MIDNDKIISKKTIEEEDETTYGIIGDRRCGVKNADAAIDGGKNSIVIKEISFEKKQPLLGSL